MRGSLLVVAFSLFTLAGCHKTSRVPALALEECDPARFIPCARQEAFASIPITDTGAYLTYSSRWLPGPQHVWDANGLGLGGWSLNFVQRYDKASRLLTSGDGSWRRVDSVSLPSGEQAVPSYGPIRLGTAGVYRILVSADRCSARYGFQIGAQPISRR